MVPAHELGCKDQMKYYLNMKKKYVWCATQLVKQHGVNFFYKNICRDSKWDTTMNTMRSQGGWMVVAGQDTCLPFLVKHWDQFSISSLFSGSFFHYIFTSVSIFVTRFFNDKKFVQPLDQSIDCLMQIKTILMFWSQVCEKAMWLLPKKAQCTHVQL